MSTPEQGGSPRAVGCFATDITPTTAMLWGAVNPAGVEGTYGYFMWGTITGEFPFTSKLIDFGLTPQLLNYQVSGLTPATTYNFMFSCNQDTTGAYNAVVVTFATLAAPVAPTVAMGDPTELVDGVALHGVVNPEGSLTSYYFEYGPTTSYGSSTGTVSAGSGSAPVEATGHITARPGTAYHCRLVASNAGGTTASPDATVGIPEGTPGGPRLAP